MRDTLERRSPSANQPAARLPPPARGEARAHRRAQTAPTPPPGLPMPACDEYRATSRPHRASLPSAFSAPGRVPAAARPEQQQRVHNRLRLRGQVVRKTPALALSLPAPVRRGHQNPASAARAGQRARSTTTKAGGERSSPSLNDQVLALADGKTQPEIAAACKGARPNHVGAAIARHKRAGRIEERDGRLYARQPTGTERNVAV